MSLVISFHAWDGFGGHGGSHIWTHTFGFVTVTLTRPTIEHILKQLRDAKKI